MGEFYTPLAFADKAFKYLCKTVGEWWKSGKFRLWDMAAGTGNLEFALPAEALKYCYISTLLDDDADYCRKIFPDATVFQYDYLNDDVNFFDNEAALKGFGVKRKMPARLVADLKNPKLRWIIFINPPYVTANDYSKQSYRNGVSDTAIKRLMTAEGFRESSRELYVQFLYRISREFFKRQAWLGMFSSLRYVTTVNDNKFRDKYFSCAFERGFIFSSQNFNGCKGKFPVGFLIWNLGKKTAREQKIPLDVYNDSLEKFAVKEFYPSRPEESLNKWIEHPPNIKKFPPMSSALNVGYKNKVRCDLIADGFLAGFMCKGNDLYQQNWTAFLSGSYVSGHGMSITPENFERCMIVHLVRKLPKGTWLNNKDQFLQPVKELTPEFISDAVIWSLFAASNQTVSLRNVEYEGKVYRMPNNLYPFELAEARTWTCSSPNIRLQLELATEDRFAATWIKNHKLSVQAQTVLDAGRELYKKFYAGLATLDVRRWKIADWDVGWYQIRMALGESISLEELSAKLLPQIYELGFLRDKVRYF